MLKLITIIIKKDTEVICVCYRIYYKPLFTLNPNCRRMDTLNETILIETNFRQAQITTRRSIKWNEIELPENWIMENVVQNEPIIQSDLIDLRQNNDGSINFKFDGNRLLKSSSNRSLISPFDYKVEYPTSVPSRASTSQIREDKSEIEEEDRLIINRRNIARPINNVTRNTSTVDEDITPSEFEF